MRNIVSVDIETTGLHPKRHETWEVAIVPVDDIKAGFCYQLPVTLVGADREALDVGRFTERYWCPRPGRAIRRWPSGAITSEPLDQVLGRIASALAGAHLLGCSVHFDANFLAELLERANYPARWHHRYLDLGSFAGGAWDAKGPLSGRAMADRYPNPEAHDALADAEWNVEVYRNIVAKSGGHPDYPA